MPLINPTTGKILKTALVAAVPFLLLAGALAPEDAGPLLDALALIAGLGAGALHISRPPANLKEAVQESVELAEQAFLQQDGPREVEAAAEQAAHTAEHAAEQLPDAAARAHQAALQATAQIVGTLTGAAAALIAAIRANKR